MTWLGDQISPSIRDSISAWGGTLCSVQLGKNQWKMQQKEQERHIVNGHTTLGENIGEN